MAEFRCTVVADPERSEQTRRITIFLKYQEELFALPFQIAFSSKASPSEGKRGGSGGLARFFPSSSLATSFPRVQVAPPPPLCSSRTMLVAIGSTPRGTNSLARASKENEHPSAFKLVPKNLPTLHTFPPPPEINLDNKKRSPLVFSFRERENSSKKNLE